MLRRLVRKTMPGPVTFIVEVSDEVIAQKLANLGLPPETRPRLYHHNTIGLRCPDHEVAQAVLSAAEEPVVASSANRAGRPAPTDAAQAAEALGDDVDLILDGGASRYARASSILTVRGDHVQLVRQGVLDERYLKKLLRQNILFVCSGNTCRSPMAEVIARHELSRRLGVEPEKLDDADVQVLSAGAFAFGGASMAPEARQALEALGLAVPPHTARPLTLEMIQQADTIYCMTETHRMAVAQMLPSAAYKCVLLDPAGSAIDDPIGAGLEVYLRCARNLRELIERRLDEMGLG